jgi:sirohydrochlorin cobaltochelatase
MKAIIVVAHGSRMESSNNEIIVFVKRLKEKVDDKNLFITYAFLENASPSIEESIKYCIDKGIKNIKIFPYFLAAGKHITKDIPEIVEKAKKSHLDIKIELTDYLGKLKGLEDLILDNLKMNNI